MRERIGYFVARKDAEQTVVRIAVGISQQFLCKHDRADRVHALIDDESIGAAVFTGDSATCSPISIVYPGENITDPATFEIAGAISGFGLFD
jgi:hypothetical protein